MVRIFTVHYCMRYSNNTLSTDIVCVCICRLNILVNFIPTNLNRHYILNFDIVDFWAWVQFTTASFQRRLKIVTEVSLLSIRHMKIDPVSLSSQTSFKHDIYHIN